MADDAPATGEIDLQFDRVVTPSGFSTAADARAVTCSVCSTSIGTEYYDANGRVVCASCRAVIESSAETPRGVAPLAVAGMLGLGAGIVGAIIYYAVIALANLEIGIVAILIGYMVGYAVRKGAGGRGGRRFQIMAVALTYFSVALAYAPLAVKGALEAERQRQEAAAEPSPAAAEAAAAPTATPAADDVPSLGGLLAALAMMLAVTMALPVLVVIGSFPSGLISAFIIFIGMRQAWVMTRAPVLTILGPFRVGAGPPAATT